MLMKVGQTRIFRNGRHLGNRLTRGGICGLVVGEKKSFSLRGPIEAKMVLSNVQPVS